MLYNGYAQIATVFGESWDQKSDLKQWILPKTLVRIDYCPSYQDFEQSNCICAKSAQTLWLGDGRDGTVGKVA